MQIQREELIQRTERMRSVMHENNLDALIIYSDEYRSGNGTYFTNYKPINLIEESPQMLCLIGDLPPTLFIGRLNAYSAVKTVWIEDVRPIHRLDEFVPEVFNSIINTNARIGLIGDNLLPLSNYRVIERHLGDAEFVPCTNLLIELRQVKSDNEIALMRQAAEIDDEVLAGLLKKIHIGQTETQVAAEAEYIGRKMGADLGSATVVMSGPNTNFPAWRPSDRAIEAGDFVLVDFNPAVGNYCNDGGVTVLMPGASTEKADALAFGHKVIKEVIPLIQPNTVASTIYDMMLARLEPAGYADNFVPYAKGQRGVGHGVGLDVVEQPDLTLDSDFDLLPGMTLAIKLDLHGLTGGGFRIECVIAITESGVDPLNRLILSENDTFTIL
ncbi:MAG: Xaa-Pro peptidase family protein [Gammaproteobacteria bacterium]|jgi:Xaa-Pro aminopeptidase|nr:Xaa-Pro peptidase family protein [Gammaproteobacteria bacterium]|tara:strand:+ start:477 stop:1631 length:1155 start_codon:yes stop_codon:yes gene_type:complete